MFEAGRIKLTDCRIARSRDGIPLTMAGMTVGRPEYTAPRLLAGMEPTARSDIYSFGVALSLVAAYARAAPAPTLGPRTTRALHPRRRPRRPQTRRLRGLDKRASTWRAALLSGNPFPKDPGGIRWLPRLPATRIHKLPIRNQRKPPGPQEDRIEVLDVASHIFPPDVFRAMFDSLPLPSEVRERAAERARAARDTGSDEE